MRNDRFKNFNRRRDIPELHPSRRSAPRPAGPTRVVPLLSDEPLPLVRPKHAIKCGPPLRAHGALGWAASFNPASNRSRFITRGRLLRRGTYLNPQALTPQAFRFEAGQGSDLMSATWHLLPRIDVMMFCPERLVKRAWIWISAKARVAVGNGGRSALFVAP